MGKLVFGNFEATVDYSQEDDTFIGKIDGVKSIVSFEGNSVEELKKAFSEAIADYVGFLERSLCVYYKTEQNNK